MTRHSTDLATPVPQLREVEPTIDIIDVTRTLWRRSGLILIAGVAMATLAAAYAFGVAQPRFHATAQVILQPERSNVVDLQSVVGGLSSDTASVSSELQVLRSRSLLSQVAADLNLMVYPEFNPALRPPQFLDTQLAAIRRYLPSRTVPSGGPLTPTDPLNTAVSILMQSVQVRNIDRSLVFEVRVETGQPDLSARIANAIANRYVANQASVKRQETLHATTWLTDQIAGMKADLEAREAEVAAFNAATDLISVEDLRGAEIRLKELRGRQAAITGQTPAAKARRQALTQAAADLETRIERQNQSLFTLQQLQREAQAKRLLYEHFLMRLNETAAQEGLHASDSRVLSFAIPPETAALPRKPLITLIGGLFGLLLGSAYVLAREQRSDTFRTSRGLERHTGKSVLGQIPLLPNRRRNAALTYLTRNPQSAAAEAVRNLRTSLMLSGNGQPPRLIVLTSALPSEGKTTVSLALAQNFAAMGKRTLLLECDVRRQVFGQYFRQKPSNGWQSVIRGDAQLPDTIFQDPETELNILFGEPGQRNAADEFSAAGFETLLHDLSQEFDHVIIDTPPVLVVPDARIIAGKADATLVVVKWDATARTQVDGALRMFETVGQNVTGLVLSQVNPKGMRRYGQAGDYGAYGTYGARYYHG